MNGTEIRQLNAEDAAEYQAVFLGALQSAPAAFAADYGEESARSSDQIAERFRREVIFGAFVDGRLCAIATFLQQPSPKRRHVGMIWNMYVSEERRGTVVALDNPRTLQVQDADLCALMMLKSSGKRNGASSSYWS